MPVQGCSLPLSFLCDVLKVMSYGFYTSCPNTFVILCPVDILYCLLNCVTETIEVTEGRRYFSREPHVGQFRIRWQGSRGILHNTFDYVLYLWCRLSSYGVRMSYVNTE